MTAPQPIAVANYHCQTGENPLWNEREQRIYWEDIDSGRLFRAEHLGGTHECFYQGDPLGGFVFQEDGTLLLFEANRIAVLEPDSGRRRVILEGIDSDMERFNDVVVDPEGRVFVGTIGRTDQSGGVYRLDLDGSVQCLWKGTGISNGMAFTGDLSRFYWTCSTSKRIFLLDYDRATGTLSNRRLFYTAAAEEGTPDGLTIDADDHLWSAHWGGGSVSRISPEGKIISRIEFPVSRVSSVEFGGSDLDALYVTTAGGSAESETADGTLYRVPSPGTRGRPEFRAKIRV